jgi:Kef-type K+ transport system membrane component KefB
MAVRFLVFQSIVQVETLGEFGVFFTLFLVGLEFSPEKLRKVSTSSSVITRKQHGVTRLYLLLMFVRHLGIMFLE